MTVWEGNNELLKELLKDMGFEEWTSDPPMWAVELAEWLLGRGWVKIQKGRERREEKQRNGR